jgi:signal peptidase I
VLSVVAPCVSALLIQAFLFKPYRVPSESMEPTISVGDRILVNRLGDPEVGDVVVFHPPSGAATNECASRPRDGQMCARPQPGELDVAFVKRIVAGPGDRVALRAGRVVRNGRLVEESYVTPCPGEEACEFPIPVTVPAGHWLVLGDNRAASDDSRFWGAVPDDAIVGTKVLTYWHG